MKLYGQAVLAAQKVVDAFRTPETLPHPLAQIFINRKDGSPCRAWSWRNQIIVALNGHRDARGYRQWLEVGRHVRKGEKAYYILSPVTKTIEDEKTGEDKTIIFGFKGTPVFGCDQTEGEPLPEAYPQVTNWLENLPLIEVARKWGLTVEGYNGIGANALGKYRQGKAIALGVENLSTWTHELVHAADYGNGKLKELGQHWRSEIVAELGGAVLLTMLGYEHDADLGGCWEYIQRYADSAGIEVFDACGKVLGRTCEAVALILDTAEELCFIGEEQKVA